MSELVSASSAPSAFDQYYVSMRNELVLGKFEWSITMHRILMVLISQLDSRDQTHFKSQFVKVQDLIRLTDQKRGSQYRQAKDAVQGLVHYVVEMDTKEGWQGVPLFGYIRYLDHSGLVAARFSEYARPYLLQLEKQFTSWRMEQTIRLSTGYAIRHYMLGKMIQRTDRCNQKTFALDDYRKRLMLEDKYARFDNLKRRVIAPAIEEVNDETDVNMHVEVNRVGRKPVGLTFIVEKPLTKPKPIVHRVHRTPDVEPHDKWLGNLDPKEYQDVLAEAKRVAQRNGYENDGSWTWKAGVETALRQIFRRYKENALS